LLRLARKNLFSERTRLAISVGGVALAVLLIATLLALYRGWENKVGVYIEKSEIDVWVASEGTTDFLSAASILPDTGEQFLEDNPSVVEWAPLIVRPMLGVKVDVPVESNAQEVKGEEMDLHFMGFDTTKRLGGPIKVVEGEDTPGPGEVIADTALTKRYGLGVGDTVWAGGRNWTVVGISEGGEFVAAQTVFVSLEQARETLQMPDLATFYVMTMTEKFRYEDVKKFTDDLEILQPGIVAFTREEFAEATREQILSNILPILAMVLGLAFIVGLAVAGLTIYTATVEKAREYGILKAVGFKNAYLYRTVLEQSLVTGILGFGIGLGLTLAFAPFASDLVPQFVMLTRWQDVIGVGVATLLMSAVAAYIPVRRLASIDPVTVFKA